MKKRFLTLALVLLCVMLVFTACSSTATQETASAEESAAPESTETEESAETGEAPADGDTYKVAFIGQNATVPSIAYMNKMFEKHAPTYNMEFTPLDGKGDPATQAQQIADCVNQGYDVIMITPSDPNSIIPSFMAAQEAGVVTVMFSSDLPEEAQQYRDIFVGSDDFVGGQTAAQTFIDQFPDGANIVVIGGLSGHSATINRNDGFLDVIEGSNINILDSLDCADWDANYAMDIMQNFIVKYGDEIDGVFCHWDGGFSGCIQAMKDANVDPDNVFGVAIDGNKDGFNNVREGYQAVTIMQNFDVQCELALELAYKKLQGEEIDAVNMPPWTIVTPENIDDFEVPEW